MIVKNEEAMLGRCLESVREITDEMIVVDTGSTDRTVEIAERFGAKIFYYPWDGSFSNARNYAMRQATMDWIWIMDADDEFEKQDTDKLRDMISGSCTATAYYCKTMSYLGDTPSPANVLCNLNIYLVKNHMGYRFIGDIHEQMSCSDPAAKAVTAISDMRVYHYGYLNDPARSKSKRERNIAMIQKELEKRPDDAFMLYNLGNEYFALLKLEDALDCYLKSFAHFIPEQGFSPKLILRLVTCCELLGKTAEQLQFIDAGLKHYPGYTDLEFLRGALWLKKERYLASIRSFKKCLKMGEAPLYLSFAAGVGTFKPAHMLCQIHYNLGEAGGAMRYGRMALKFEPHNCEVLNLMAALLMENISPAAAAKRLSRMLPALPDKYLMLSDVFYSLRRFELALALARRAARRGEDADTAYYDQGACLLYLKRYGEALRMFRQLDGTVFEDRAALLGRLCALFTGDAADSEPPCGDDPHFAVLRRYEALMSGQGGAPLAADEKTSEPYIAPIFSLLDILIRTDHFDEFDKARRLLNLVTDDTVLMRLGKLYFHNGYLKFAYRELERSIKLTGKTDVEALRMMKYILDNKALDK